MTITTYAELKTAVNNWRENAHADARLVEFIALAENRLNRDLPLRTFEQNTTLTGTPSSRSIALPTGFLEPIALFLTTDGNQTELLPLIAGNQALSTANGTPRAWMINGTNIDLDCPLSAADTFLFRYRGSFALATTDPNWLLTNHPDVYLWASLVEAAFYEQDNDAAVAYELRLKQAVENAGWLAARSKAKAPLRFDPMLVIGRRYDYTTDTTL